MGLAVRFQFGNMLLAPMGPHRVWCIFMEADSSLGALIRMMVSVDAWLDIAISM